MFPRFFSNHGPQVSHHFPANVPYNKNPTVVLPTVSHLILQLHGLLQEAFSVAFHPSGFHLIAGFADKLRLMNLLMEDFRTYKEIPIKAMEKTMGPWRT